MRIITDSGNILESLVMAVGYRVCFVLCVIVSSLPTSNGNRRKLLIPLPPVTKVGSHCNVLRSLSSALAQRGHEVHLLRSSNKACRKLDEFRASKIIEYDARSAEWPNVKATAVKAIAGQRFFETMALLSSVLKFSVNMCRNLLEKKDIIEKLHQQNYNVMIADLGEPCNVLVVNYLHVPFVALTTSRQYMTFQKPMYGFPSELAYVPELGSGFTHDLTFTERIRNLLIRMYYHAFNCVFFYEFGKLQKEFDIEPKLSLVTMQGKAKLWLRYSNSALDYPEPTMPNSVSIGGLAIEETRPLSKELEDFINGAGYHGVIVFSLGSIVDSLPDDYMTEMIASVFSRLPQRVIWRHASAQPTNIGNNTKILEWIPQNDLLGHPQTRLFIGHGGINGVYEAIYHAVPMIMIPLLFPDQWDNAARVVSKGMGLKLDSKTITEETFYDSITDVLNNPRYQENVSFYSAILRDLPPAKDRAVFWVEHVLKYGDSHLRAHVFELNLIQYYHIDAVVFFIFFVIILLLVLRGLCNCCCRLCK